MASKKGLGRGLDMMIPERIKLDKKSDTNDVSRETLINISDIEPNKSQPRKRFDEDSLIELSDSIKEYGIIQPIILQKKEKFYEIVAGERRWRAAKIAGIKQVPAIIKEYTDQEVLEISLIENIQREDLNPIEEALTYQRLITDFNLTQEELANRVSKSRVAITNSLRLLKLDGRVQSMLIDQMISSGHARAMIGIEDGEKQYLIACKVYDEKLSVRNIEKLIKDSKKDKGKEEKKEKEGKVSKEEYDLVYRNLENQICHILGTKVKIQNKNKNKGKIEIEYYSNDDLERIIDMFKSLT